MSERENVCKTLNLFGAKVGADPLLKYAHEGGGLSALRERPHNPPWSGGSHIYIYISYICHQMEKKTKKNILVQMPTRFSVMSNQTALFGRESDIHSGLELSLAV